MRLLTQAAPEARHALKLSRLWSLSDDFYEAHTLANDVGPVGGYN